MSSPALTICPKELCGMKKWGRGKVKRAISAGAGLLFKGSGFYTTDYRSENYKAASKKDSAASETKSTPAATSAATTPKSDSKATGTSKPAGSGSSSGGKEK
jgi:predicted nucleic acid-binding Zn ribbon protein